jgi:hypothetical protein
MANFTEPLINRDGGEGHELPAACEDGLLFNHLQLHKKKDLENEST